MVGVLLTGVLLFAIAGLVLGRYVLQQVKRKLQKAGVRLSCGSINLKGIKSVAVVLEKGPLQCLQIDSVAWGAAASSESSNGDDTTPDRSVQQTNSSVWLPIKITGLHVLIASSSNGQGVRSHAKVANQSHSKARAAATVPAVSSALALAKRLLPRVSIKLQQVAVELKGQGLCVRLGKASLQWAADAQSSSLCSTLQLQEVTLAPDLQGESLHSWKATERCCVGCPSLKLSIGIGPSRGLLPVSCTHVALQVSQIKVAGLGELLLLAAAAAKPGKPGVAVKQPSIKLQELSCLSKIGHSSAAVQHAKDSRWPMLPADIAKAVTLLPDKVKVSFAGIKLVSCTAPAAAAESFQALPQLRGSVGAITLAASSCQRLAAVRHGEQLLNLTFSLGPVQASVGAEHAASSSGGDCEGTAVQCKLAGFTVALDLCKSMIDESTSNDKPTMVLGPLQQHLRSQQQTQQKYQLRASSTCTVIEQPSVQLYAAQLPSLLRGLQLLLNSLQLLARQRQVAAEAAAAASSACAPADSREQLPRTGSISPVNSLASLSQAETPVLGTPHSSVPLQSPCSLGLLQQQLQGYTGDGSSTAGCAAAAAATSTSAGAVLLQQRSFAGQRSSFLHAEYVSLSVSATVAAASGFSIEVCDGSGAVVVWMSLQQGEADAQMGWQPADCTNSQDSFQGVSARELTLAAAASLQQLVLRVAPAEVAGSGRLPMQQVLLLDLVTMRAHSTEAAVDVAAVASDAATSAQQTGQQTAACDMSVAIGQLNIAPDLRTISALLQLAFVVPGQPDSSAATSPLMVAASGCSSVPTVAERRAKKHRHRRKLLSVASVSVSVQSGVLKYTSDLPVCRDFAKAVAAEATSRGVQSQVTVSVSSAQLSIQPAQQYLGAAVHLLQVGYTASGCSSFASPVVQSVELLLMQGVEFRRYLSPDLQLLKVAFQQLRSDLHVDAAVAGIGMAEAALARVAACGQHLQEQHAAAAAAAEAQHELLLSVAASAAAMAGISTTQAAAVGQGGLAAEDSFSLLAGRVSPANRVAAAAAAGPAAGLPPVSRPSISGQLQTHQQPQKRILALEARLQDVAVQLSVCDKDALLIQMELVKYNSVLEQCVVEKMRFSINERSVVQIPHLAVHHLPGWLPPGAAASVALNQQQRAWSPDRGSSKVSTTAAACSKQDEVGHKSWSITPDQVSRYATAGGSPGPADRSSQQFECSASFESVRFCDDGGVQSWQSIDDAVPSASIGSRRPANSKDPGLYQRQAARQQASRDRCKVAQTNADNSSDTAATGLGAVMTLDIYAEQVLFSVPHDEAPGRIILVCETWAKAVKQVIKAQVSGIKSSMSGIKAAQAARRLQTDSPTLPKGKAVKKPKPAYLELQVHLQHIVFCLEQHPLETWMGLHGPALQAMAAERHLTEQLLASCSTANGRISRTGGNAAGSGGGGAHTRDMQLAVKGKKQRGQWQRRRWGSLGRRSSGVAAAIAAGSVADAAVAAAMGPAAATMAALASGSSDLHTGPAEAFKQATQSASTTAEGMISPPVSPHEAALGELHSDAEGATDDEGSADPAAADELVASDYSEELDSSEEEEAAGIDPDALAAALPSSASALTGTGGAAAMGPSGAADVGQDPKSTTDAADQAEAAAQGTSEMQQAVLQAHVELFAMYKFRCRPLLAAAADSYHQSRSVMHISVARIEGVVLICLPGHAASAAMANEVISRVDPATEGIPMERYQSISIDVGMQELVAHFGGVEEMASTIGSLGASGLLIRARQLSAPPQTWPMRMSVGSWHEADVPVVIKGTRPPMKMYTDIKAELDDVQGSFCPGLEAPFGQLNLAFKRITVPNFLNPDGTIPPSTHPGLPWWDMMGYMWRGVASVRIRGLTAVLANTQSPHVGLKDEKLALTAATLSVAVAAGKIEVTTTNMSALAHAAAPDAGQGDPLLVLPAFHLPLVTLTFNITSKLPGGRNPLLHHCFPIRTEPPGPGAPCQEFVDVFALMKSEGWSLGIDITVNSDKTPTAGTAVQSRATPRPLVAVVSTPAAGGSSLLGLGSAAGSGIAGSATAAYASGPTGVAASCWHYYQPYTMPHAFIGEFQIKYIIEMVDTLANPSAVVRISRKLKPFYARDRRPEAAAAAKALAAVRAQIVQMPMLKQKVEISLTADTFRVHHDAQDSEDPSDMVYIALSSVRYMNTFTYSRCKRTQQFSNGARLKDSMRQYMANLSVEAYDLKIVKAQGDQLSSMLNSAVPSGLQDPTGAGSSGGRKPAGTTPGLPDQVDRVRHMMDSKTPPRSGTAGSGAGSPSRGSPLKGQSKDLGSNAEGDSGTPDFSKGLIAAAACFLLRQAPGEGSGGGVPPAAAGVAPVDPPPLPKRPIRMIAQDVKLLCPAELRDTCMLLFHHMQKAFSGISFGQSRGPVRISTKKQQQQQADSCTSSPRRTGSDAMDSANLSRSSAPARGGSSAARGPVTSPYLSASADMSTTGLPTERGAASSAGGAASLPGAAGTGSSNSSMVSTPADEELMLRRILQQNKDAAAAKAALLARQQSAGTSAARGASAALDSEGVENSGSISSPEAESGAGHAAVAIRAVAGGAVSSKTPVTVVAAVPDSDSPHSPGQSDTASRSSIEGTSPRQQQTSDGGLEEVLLEYEIEFVQVQVNLVSDSARGSLILGTNSALLLGHLNVTKLERSVSFKMDQVQAHVVCSEMDSQQGPLWLEIANGKLSTPAGAEGIMRQVLLPFKCQLITTQQARNSVTAAALNSSTQAHLHLQPQQRPDRTSSSSGGMPPAGFAPSAGQELRLHVPSIGARLDSRQFEVLVDVIQNIAMAPLPSFPPPIRTMWRYPDGLSEDDDNQDVQYALETLQSLRERQRGLEQELLTVWHAQQQHQQLHQQYAHLAAQQHSRATARYAGSVTSGWDGASSYGDTRSEYGGHAAGISTTAPQQQGLSGLAVSTSKQTAYTDVKEAATALATSLARAGALSLQQQHHQSTGPSGTTLPLRTNSTASLGTLSRGNSGAAIVAVAALQQQDQLALVSERQTVIWWAQEQLQGALDAITASRVVLNLLRSEASVLKVRQRNSMGVNLTVDTIDWALSKGNTVIVQGELQGISYQSIRSEDHTGTTKIQLHTATFKDPKAAAAAAASTSKAHSSSQQHHLTELSSSEGSSMHGSSTDRDMAGAADNSDAGIILAPWNPDESWEQDELVRIYAIHGALEKRHVVYEHIEVLVHPIRVHLTAALAAALQDYFNLKDEDNKLQSGAAGKGGKQAAALREDKRRATAPGDIPAAAGGQATATTPGSKGKSSLGSSTSSAVGTLTAAASRARPSIFHRRAAAAAAAAAASAVHAAGGAAAGAAAVPSAAITGASAAVAVQPQIVVPPVEISEVGIHPLEVGKTGSLTPADSPAVEVAVQFPASDLAAADDSLSIAADSTADTASLSGSYAVSSVLDSGYYSTTSVLAPPSPGPCVQPVTAEAALLMRYGAVVRGRAGRAAGSTPSTPVSGSAGGAAGTAPFAAAGPGPAGGSAGSYGSAGGGGSGAVTPGGAAGGALTPGAASASTAAAAALVKKPVRSIKFKHVRFNRMHARLTYEGPPLSINGFGLVLDNRVYRNIDGGWRTVLNRYKWDAIRSLVKSFSGLQARKLQELQIPNFGAEPSDTFDALRSSSGFRAGLMSLLKGKRPAGKLRLHGGDSPGYGYGGADAEGGADLAEGSVMDDSAGVSVGGSDYLELMRDALRAKQKAKKIAMLLGNVPALPQQPGVVEG